MSSRPIFPTQNPNPNTRSKPILIAITISATLIFLLTIIYILYYLWHTLFRRSRTNPFHSYSHTLTLHKWTYNELKSATNGFNPENAIGKGGSGTVFRGILKDGKSVAVKKIDGDEGYSREFETEINVLGTVKSRYVVSLLGYCVEKDKRLLVYEFMANGSLQDRLFCDDGGYCMEWERRFRVLEDVAKGIEFLHCDCRPPVVHGDVKPSNVLLDWEFKAKLSDFGLSRVKVEDEDEGGVAVFSQELSGNLSQELFGVKPGVPMCSQELSVVKPGVSGFSQELSGNLSQELSGVKPGVSGFNPEFSGVKPGVSGFSPELSGNLSQELSGVKPGVSGFSQELPGNSSHIAGECGSSSGEVDFALALQASGSCKRSRGLQNMSSPKGKEVLVEEEEMVSSVEHNKEVEVNHRDRVEDVVVQIGCGKQWGKDWWWKQEDSGELCSKEYVNEWIGTQVGSSTTRDWESMMSSPIDSNLDSSPQLGNPVTEFQLDCLKEKRSDEKNPRKSKPRKMLDWWKEEELDEIKKKGSNTRKTLESKMKKTIKLPRVRLGRRFYILKRRISRNQSHCDDELNNCEYGFSKELSSTTSMRGTLCYVAPEYGGCGYLMEKSDIYSLGVLILVIVSGRRPLHVLNSPMKLEKANLVSWCRHLGQAGNVLELVDERLKDVYDKEQVTLCIHLALACLQRVPELRPDIGDVVRILRGEMELPSLPFDFSPSPTSKFYSRSRRKDTGL